MAPRQIVPNGTYRLSIASLDSSGNLSNIYSDVSITFKGQKITFMTPDGTRANYAYDYSWGNGRLNQFIIGDGSGGYYVIARYPNDLNGNYDYSYSSDFTQNTWTKTTSDGQTYQFTQDTSGTASQGDVSGSQFTFNPCFLPGTLIQTAEGQKVVESLTVGDHVMTYDPKGQQRSIDTIIWVGRNRTTVIPGMPRDMAGYPVRITAGSIADGVPFKDLLVTAEHCVFLEGYFVPARMLVNGKSIYFDTSISEFTYYHIETEKHAIIMSDGLFTESYLDTGQRNLFQSISHANSPRNVRSWSRDAAAPLRTSREFVEPLYQRFLKRAGIQNESPSQSPEMLMDQEPNLFLMTHRRDVIREMRRTRDYRLFLIPRGTRYVELMSRSFRPCDVIGPFVDDRRDLGVLVGDIKYCTSHSVDDITIHLEREALYGWSLIEKTACRWTHGKAVLPLPGGLDEEGILAIRLCGGGPYPMNKDIRPEMLKPSSFHERREN